VFCGIESLTYITLYTHITYFIHVFCGIQSFTYIASFTRQKKKKKTTTRQQSRGKAALPPPPPPPGSRIEKTPRRKSSEKKERKKEQKRSEGNDIKMPGPNGKHSEKFNVPSLVTLKWKCARALTVSGFLPETLQEDSIFSFWRPAGCEEDNNAELRRLRVE
jgi:hypothetical protein